MRSTSFEQLFLAYKMTMMTMVIRRKTIGTISMTMESITMTNDDGEDYVNDDDDGNETIR